MRFDSSVTSGHIRWVLALAVALLASGCPDKKPKYPSCNGDKDCKAGEHCVDKKCVQCEEDDDCGAGQVCEANACVKKPGYCSSDDDCEGGKVCKDHACVACTSDVECGAGGRCDDGACLRKGECKRDEDCADEEDCINGRCTRGGGGGTLPTCALHTIYFDFDSSAISDTNRGLLDQTADCMKSTDRGVRVIGHTDPRGTEEYNIALSEGRSRSVADFLARLGIDPARFAIVPKGETEATGTDESSWRQDRRVDFEWQ